MRTYAIAGIARSGATRSGDLPANYVQFWLAGVNRTKNLDNFSWVVDDELNDAPNSLTFEVLGITPALYDLVTLYGTTGKEFEGRIVTAKIVYDRKNNRAVWRCKASDYRWDLDGTLVTGRYSGSASDIAAELLALAPAGFTGDHIAAGLPTVDEIQFTMTPLGAAFRQLADAFGGDTYVDYDQDIHLFETETDVTPKTLNTSNTDWRGFSYEQSSQGIQNRIYCQGDGTTLIADAAVGDTTINITASGAFSDSGGSAIAENQVITYTGIGAGYTPNNDWSTQDSALATDLLGVAWSTSLGLFVAVANNSLHSVMTSPDGVTWTERSTGISDVWTDVVWSPDLNLFVAVGGNSTTVMTSPNGITWTGRTSSVSQSVAWSPSLTLFAAVGLGGVIKTSPDGITWTTRTSPSPRGWNSVTWAPAIGLFVAVAGDGTSATGQMTSSDGVTWTSQTSPSSLIDWRCVAWSSSLGLLAAVGAAGKIMTSPNGTTWTDRTSPEANTWRRVAWADDRFIAVSSDGTNRIMTSPDGIRWTIAAAMAAGVWRGIAWSPTLALTVVVGTSAGTIQLITNASTIFATLTGVPASGAGAILRAMSTGSEINLLMQADDAASQATYGIRSGYVVDRRLSQDGAQDRANAELTLRASKREMGTYKTNDFFVRSGREITVDMNAEWGIADTWTAQRVQVEMHENRPLAERTVQFGTDSEQSIYRILRALERQRDQL